MEKIAPGKYFELAYKLYRVNPDGTETLVHEVEAAEPDRAIFGLTPGFVEALEKEIDGKEQGYEFDFTAKPEEAFGPYDEEEIMALPRDRFLIDGKFDEEMFAPGSLIPLMTSDGYRIDGLVKELRDNDVVLDFNHPLAKDPVHYVGKVLLVREPTQEELHPTCGCGSCGCGDDCSCDSESGSCGCGSCGSC